MVKLLIAEAQILQIFQPPAENKTNIKRLSAKNIVKPFKHVF